MRDYQEKMTTGQTDVRTDGHTPDKVIPMCRYASQATQHANALYRAHMLTRKGSSNTRNALHVLFLHIMLVLVRCLRVSARVCEGAI